MNAIQIELADARDVGRCDCCGNSSRAVWGYAYRNRNPYGFYYVHWTIGHVPDYGANFDLVFGIREENGRPPHHSAASLLYRLVDSVPSFMVIDAQGRPFSGSDLVKRVLNRADVLGRPIAQEIFVFCDSIVQQDDRVSELVTLLPSPPLVHGRHER